MPSFACSIQIGYKTTFKELIENNLTNEIGFNFIKKIINRGDFQFLFLIKDQSGDVDCFSECPGLLTDIMHDDHNGMQFLEDVDKTIEFLKSEHIYERPLLFPAFTIHHDVLDRGDMSITILDSDEMKKNEHAISIDLRNIRSFLKLNDYTITRISVMRKI